MTDQPPDPFVPFEPGPAPATVEEIAAARADEHRAEQEQRDAAPPPVEPIPYLVTGSQRVHETPPGEVVHLDPEAPQTLRLIERGQIQPVDTTEGDE